jgi:preprotein translocase subunit SecD
MLNQYPLWKNLLLIVIVLLGLLYAAPNLYGDDPAVQVSPPTGVKTDAALVDRVTTILTTAALKTKSIVLDKQNMLVRFYDTDTELKAKTVLQTALGDDYTVAVNIAPATPQWLTAINAAPMKLGLDLRGGVHFFFPGRF